MKIFTKAKQAFDRSVYLSRFRTFDDEKKVAVVAWGEARGESDAGVAGVVNVIRNRVNDPKRRYGKSVFEVLTKASQFSCLNADDPNLKYIRRGLYLEDLRFSEIEEIVEDVFDGKTKDTTKGANLYHSTNVRPWWANSPRVTFLVRIGHHMFYRE